MAPGGPAGTALCAYHPPPSPAGLTAAADRCFPRYYNNQQATARSEPLRRRPPPRADNARLRARRNVVTAALCGRRALLSGEVYRVLFPLSFSPLLKGRLQPRSPSATLNRRVRCVSGRTGVKLGQRQPLIGSKGVHAPSPARAKPEQPIRARADGNNPIPEPACGRGRGQMAQVDSSLDVLRGFAAAALIAAAAAAPAGAAAAVLGVRSPGKKPSWVGGKS